MRFIELPDSTYVNPDHIVAVYKDINDNWMLTLDAPIVTDRHVHELPPRVSDGHVVSLPDFLDTTIQQHFWIPEELAAAILMLPGSVTIPHIPSEKEAESIVEQAL